MNPENADDKNLILVEKAKRWFLEVAEGFRKSQEKYNLEREFAATKKNRRPWVLLSVLGSSLLFTGLAWLLVSTYERENNNVKINSKEFDDIAQRDLLNEAKDIEAELDFALTALAQQQAQLESDIAKVKSVFEDQLTLARTSNLKADALSARSAVLEAARDREISLVRSKFDAANVPALIWRTSKLGWRNSTRPNSKTLDSRK